MGTMNGFGRNGFTPARSGAAHDWVMATAAAGKRLVPFCIGELLVKAPASHC